MKKFLAATAVAAMVGLGAGAASATTMIYSLDVDTCTGTCGLGSGASYGTVTVTGLGTKTLSFDIELVKNVFFNQAGKPAELFSLAGSPTVTLSDITPSASFGVAGSQSAGSYFANGTLGTFDYEVTYIGPNGNGDITTSGIQSLKFDVTAMTDLSLVASSLGKKTSDIYFAADLYGANGNTGRVGARAGVSAVPEPGAWALMLVGLGGLGAALRSRRRATAAA